VLIWKTLHILSMVSMVTAFIGAEIFYAAAIARRDVGTLAFVHRTVERAGLGWVGMGGILAGIVFGLLTAATGGFDFVAPWLLIAYVLVGVFFVNAFAAGARIVHVAKAAVEADAGEREAADVVRDMGSTRAVWLVASNAVVFALIIADMVLKPSF
jgi:uncharacterized membrane protein